MPQMLPYIIDLNLNEFNARLTSQILPLNINEQNENEANRKHDNDQREKNCIPLRIFFLFSYENTLARVW